MQIIGRQRAHVASVLDYGCGDGFTGEAVQARFHARSLVGVDVHLPPEACGTRTTAAGTLELLRDDANLGERRFELVLLCDVIEHVEEDADLMSRVVNRWLAPGGLVLVTVPAFQTLFSAHDHALKHYRRYDVEGLLHVVRAAGLECIEEGYLFGSLLPLRVATKIAEELRGAKPEQEHGIGGWTHGSVLSSALTLALELDNAALLAARRLGLRLPGLTAWALCKTRS
jgi:trans-aconitate methyltransferase